MKFEVLTLFPEMIREAVQHSMLGRAIESGAICVDAINIRDFADNRRAQVDDYPYGGGAGIVMEAEPVYRAVCEARQRAGHARVVYLTPQAEVLDQLRVEELASEEALILLCGHYEGIDERVLKEVVTDYVSIGDYVLTGGELAALVLIDAVARFVPGVLGNAQSVDFESMQDALLEYPHYTRPEVWHGSAVPEILRSGDHAKVEAWRYEMAKARTAERRPDLLRRHRCIRSIWYGDAETGAYAAALTARLTRYGTLYDFNRRTLQKREHFFKREDLLLLFSSAEEETAMRERFRRIHGEETACILVGERDAALERLLAKRGFSLLAEMGAGEIGATALKIRRKIAESVNIA